MTTVLKDRKSESLSQTVYNALLNKILDGIWQPGTIYDRRSVAKELGVSIAPVSEAMIRLENDGFMINLPRKGTMLRPSDPRRLYENMILREAIECQALQMIFPIADKSLNSLRKLAKKTDNNQGQKRWKADVAFHRELVVLSGIGSMLKCFDNLQLQVAFDSLRVLATADSQTINHTQLVEKLATAESHEDAAAFIRRHLRAGRQNLYEHFESHSTIEKNQDPM